MIDTSKLKVGDEVVISHGHHSYRMAKVVGITPTGRIKTDSGETFAKDGREFGGRDPWLHVSLVEFSDRAKRYFASEKASMLWHAINRRLKDIPAEQLDAISAALQVARDGLESKQAEGEQA